jgi:hypothetical protein
MQAQSHITFGNGSATVAPGVNGNGSPKVSVARRVINGRGIALLRGNKRARAVLAAQIADGAAILQPSVAQLSRLFGVSVTYIDRARKLTPETREDILSGLETRQARAAFRPPAPPAARTPVNDNVLDELVRALGPERVFAAIERVI